MEAYFLAHEPVLRISVFAAVLVFMGLWETLAPRRPVSFPKARRWATNLGLSVFNSLCLRLLVPVLAVGAAAWAEANQIGLLNQVALPRLAEWAIAFLALDLLIYGQHVVFHYVPLFWRLHKVHHADPDFDTSTGIRFHPAEILLTMAIKLAAVVALGAAPYAVILFEVVLNGAAMFNHANFRLPLALDRRLRLFLVTPDMHRVHHSVIRSETDSNYGFNLAVWDRIFGTYTDQPREGHEGMVIGLAEYQHEGPTGILWSLALPFRRPEATADAPPPEAPASVKPDGKVA